MLILTLSRNLLCFNSLNPKVALVITTETYDTKITKQECFHRDVLMVEFILGNILINCLRLDTQIPEKIKLQQR